jgi:hypothetical protein
LKASNTLAYPAAIQILLVFGENSGYFSKSIFPRNFLNGFLLALRLHPPGISIWDHCQWQMEEKSNPL